MNELDLKNLVGEADGTILISGLQALWRERTAAYNCAADITAQKGLEMPLDRSLFGIDEVNLMLRRVGAAAYKF